MARITTEAEALRLAAQRYKKDRRDRTVIRFVRVDGSENPYYRIYLTSLRGQAFKDCKVGWGPEWVADVYNDLLKTKDRVYFDLFELTRPTSTD